MKTLILIFIFFLFPNKSINNEDCLEMDIVLVLDFSETVQGYENFVIKALEAFASRFEISEDRVRMGIVVFNNKPTVVSNLTGNKNQIFENIIEIKEFKADGGTYMFPALKSAELEFKKNPRDARKMIIFISDGKPSDYETNWQNSEALGSGGVLGLGQRIKSKGIEIWSVFINNGDQGRDFMLEISSIPYFFDSDYRSLISTLKKLDLCT